MVVLSILNCFIFPLVIIEAAYDFNIGGREFGYRFYPCDFVEGLGDNVYERVIRC